jgi:hypothetical protein
MTYVNKSVVLRVQLCPSLPSNHCFWLYLVFQIQTCHNGLGYFCRQLNLHTQNELSTYSNVLTVVKDEFISVGRNFKCVVAYLDPPGTQKIFVKRSLTTTSHHWLLMVFQLGMFKELCDTHLFLAFTLHFASPY